MMGRDWAKDYRRLARMAEPPRQGPPPSPTMYEEMEKARQLMRQIIAEKMKPKPSRRWQRFKWNLKRVWMCLTWEGDPGPWRSA
jgi:hypothetical protein